MESFDPSSGLVYRETTSASVRSMIPKWTSHSRGRRVNPSKHQRPTPGCDTLQSMALRCCIWNIDNMESEALQWLGWSYASRLYDHLKLTDTLTFRTWSLFRKAFPEDIDRHSTFHVYDPESEGLLPSVVDRLVKLDGMLTFLCIRIVDMPTNQLVSLNNINTLAVLALEIGRNTRNRHAVETLTVERLRDWGRSVGESGAFKKLRVLLIDGRRSLPTRLVLKYISSFPSLSIVGIFGPEDHPPEGERHWGDWRQHFPPDHCNETTSHSGWGSSSTTIASDMRQLYEASHNISQYVPTGGGTCQSLSMHYTQRDMPDGAREVAWFIRELKDRPVRPMKRVQEDKSRLDGKKRKVRDNKKVDMSSLLGSFT